MIAHRKVGGHRATTSVAATNAARSSAETSARSRAPIVPMTDESANLISGDIAAKLLMILPGQLDDLARKGWFKPVTKNPARYQLVEVVQGYLKSLEHEQKRPRSQSEAADHICISTRRFRELIEEGVLPRKSPQEGYDLDEVRGKFIAHQRAVAAGHGVEGSGAAALSSERAALAREKREAMQLKNAISRGDYVALAEVKRQWMPRLEIMRERLLSIPGKCSDELANREKEFVEVTLEDEISEALNELAEPTEFDGGPDRTQGS